MREKTTAAHTSAEGAGMDGATAAARPEDRFEDLVDELVQIEGVTPPRGGSGFGRSAVRFHGKIAVMLVRGSLVLKLPAQRVRALVAAGEGVHFDANKGTPMKEWLSLDPASGLAWLPLAREALDFARSAHTPAYAGAGHTGEGEEEANSNAR